MKDELYQTDRRNYAKEDQYNSGGEIYELRRTVRARPAPLIAYATCGVGKVTGTLTVPRTLSHTTLLFSTLSLCLPWRHQQNK